VKKGAVPGDIGGPYRQPDKKEGSAPKNREKKKKGGEYGCEQEETNGNSIKSEQTRGKTASRRITPCPKEWRRGNLGGDQKGEVP